MESERNFSLTLSSIHTKTALINQNMVRWDRKSIPFTNLGEVVIAQNSVASILDQIN